MTIHAVSKVLKMSPSSIKRWDQNTPSVTSVEKVADYFNVSVDYLLGRTDVPDNVNNVLSDKDLLKINRLRENLPEKSKERMIALLYLIYEEYVDPPSKEKIKQFLIEITK
jgi:transcriptional regulator with XRE-family HTH domain